jgi:hypothetical protein
MTDPLHAGSGFVFMKVGTHAEEPLDEIIERKRREVDEAGYALWGYGGNSCHPKTMVQPFARDFVEREGTIYLCMQSMDSRHFAVTERAVEYSEDGENWSEIPKPINVIGSRFALKIADLQPDDFKVPLAQTKVAIGNQTGRPGDRYIRGRVDKACLELLDEEAEGSEEVTLAQIDLVARLADPYAVFVRSAG